MEPQSEIILYQPDNEIRLEVRLEDETVWLTQAQIAVLFGTKRPAITKHLNNIYNSGELDRSSTCSILEHIGNEGKQIYATQYYNLDAILSVGYRVNSKKCNTFQTLGKQNIERIPIKRLFCQSPPDRTRTHRSRAFKENRLLCPHLPASSRRDIL